MEACASTCAHQSVGAINQLFSTLVKTIIAAQCAISPSSQWIDDYTPKAVKQCKY